MAKLDAKERKALPRRDFAVPERGEGKARRGGYPIPDESHARNALARSADKGAKVKSEVKRAVERKFPEIKVAGKKREERGKEKRR